MITKRYLTCRTRLRGEDQVDYSLTRWLVLTYLIKKGLSKCVIAFGWRPNRRVVAWLTTYKSSLGGRLVPLFHQLKLPKLSFYFGLMPYASSHHLAEGTSPKLVTLSVDLAFRVFCWNFFEKFDFLRPISPRISLFVLKTLFFKFARRVWIKLYFLVSSSPRSHEEYQKQMWRFQKPNSLILTQIAPKLRSELFWVWGTNNNAFPPSISLQFLQIWRPISIFLQAQTQQWQNPQLNSKWLQILTLASSQHREQNH